MPLIIVMSRTLRIEEEKYFREHEERFLIKEHSEALSMFIYLFLGMLMSYSLWATFLPDDMLGVIFDVQLGYLERGNIDNFGSILENIPELSSILINNFRVLFLCILFSFLYGAGAIFILTFNASIIGVYIGMFIRNSIATGADITHIGFLYNYFHSASIGFSCLIHGIPEISAYFLGALGGGIISVAVTNHDFRTDEFRHIVKDSVDLILLSCLVLIIAAVIEVYVTPNL